MARKAGRPKGTSNRQSILFKDAVQNLLDYAAPQMTDWLAQVAASESPAKALDIVCRLAEFAAPKLARTEVVGDKDAPLQHVHQVAPAPLSDKERKALDSVLDEKY